jgi:hypothetical protein
MKPNPLRDHIKFIMDHYSGDEAVDMLLRVLASSPPPATRGPGRPPNAAPAVPSSKVGVSGVPSALTSRGKEKNRSSENAAPNGLKPFERQEYYTVVQIAEHMQMSTSNVYTMIGREPEAFPCQIVKNTGAGRRDQKVYFGRGIMDWMARRKRGNLALTGIPGRSDEGVGEAGSNSVGEA